MRVALARGDAAPRARARRKTRDDASRTRPPRTRIRARVDAREAPAPPSGYETFEVRRNIALAVRDAKRGAEASVRAWLSDPVNFIGVVFGVADALERPEGGKRGGRAFTVRVRPRALLRWEISPEFAIEAVPASGEAAAGGGGRARLVGDELRFGGDRARLPPGFRSMGVWAHIDASVGVDESRSTTEETTVATDVHVRIAADIPGLLRAIPGFSSAATMAIGRSIDIVGGSINEATQETYDAWAAQRGSDAGDV